MGVAPVCSTHVQVVHMEGSAVLLGSGPVMQCGQVMPVDRETGTLKLRYNVAQAHLASHFVEHDPDRAAARWCTKTAVQRALKVAINRR